MSDAVSALPGAEAEGLITVRDAGLQGMVTIRADLVNADLADGIEDAVGVPLPFQGYIREEGDRALAWMSPDELLFLLPYGSAPLVVSAIEDMAEENPLLAVDVSDARTVFTLKGEGRVIRDVLGKLTPADLRASAMPVGAFRRTRLGQVAAAIWMKGPDEARVICFRSVSGYVFDLLKNAARDGSNVGHF